MSLTDPVAERPHAPGYEVPESGDGLLPFAWARKRLAEQPGVAWLTEPPADNSPQAWRASLAPERFPPVDETWQWGHSYGAR